VTSAGNARRHGLRIPVLPDPVMFILVEVYYGPKDRRHAAAPELVEPGATGAAAGVDVLRVQHIRSDVISRELTAWRFGPPRGWTPCPRDTVTVLNGGMAR